MTAASCGSPSSDDERNWHRRRDRPEGFSRAQGVSAVRLQPAGWLPGQALLTPWTLFVGLGCPPVGRHTTTHHTIGTEETWEGFRGFSATETIDPAPARGLSCS